MVRWSLRLGQRSPFVVTNSDVPTNVSEKNHVLWLSLFCYYKKKLYETASTLEHEIRDDLNLWFLDYHHSFELHFDRSIAGHMLCFFLNGLGMKMTHRNWQFCPILVLKVWVMTSALKEALLMDQLQSSAWLFYEVSLGSTATHSMCGY